MPNLRRRSAHALGRVAERVDGAIGWSRLPTVLGIPVLVGLRYQLRANNLQSTGGDADRVAPPVRDGRYLAARTVDGTYNDLTDPLMGAQGCRFGRNIPLAGAHPEHRDALLSPNPSLVSRRLLHRDEFHPATTLNLLAAAWIQFEVHDWLSHPTLDTDPWVIPVQDDHGNARTPMTIRRTEPDPNPDWTGPDRRHSSPMTPTGGMVPKSTVAQQNSRRQSAHTRRASSGSTTWASLPPTSARNWTQAASSPTSGSASRSCTRCSCANTTRSATSWPGTTPTCPIRTSTTRPA